MNDNTVGNLVQKVEMAKDTSWLDIQNWVNKYWLFSFEWGYMAI